MKNRNRYAVGTLAVAALLTLLASPAWAQAVGGAEKARPVPGDPGVSSMVVMDQPEFSVLRDYAEPGATRRMHSHDAVKWIVFTLVTGKLILTFEGQAPIEVEPGQVLHFKGTARHTFRNVADVTATIVEVLGKTSRE
jgi:quercetin dioxygenase-like cupin family protein